MSTLKWCRRLYHNVVGIHGLDSIQKLELYLLIVPTMLKGEVLNSVF